MEIMKLFAHIIIIIALMENTSAQSTVFVTEAEALPSACSKTPNTYFNPATLRCVACPTNTQPNEEFTGCECLPGYRRIASPAQDERKK